MAYPPDAPEMLYQELLSIRGKTEIMENSLISLTELSSKRPYSCLTFTAKHGSSTISQLNNEIDYLKDKINNLVIRGLKGQHINQRQRRRMTSTNAILSAFIVEESKDVKHGMVRQYFANETSIVVDPIEFPLENLIIRTGKKGDPASTHNFLWHKKFNTVSVENYLNYLNREKISIKSELSQSLQYYILKSKDVRFPIHWWSESATDLGSDGGFLISNQSNKDYQILFCPKCSQDLINYFEDGERRIVFPPLPQTILNLNVFCTENVHKEHTIEDCIGISELESRINQVREKIGASVHHTEMINFENEKLSQSHGIWAWLKHNQSL